MHATCTVGRRKKERESHPIYLKPQIILRITKKKSDLSGKCYLLTNVYLAFNKTV